MPCSRPRRRLLLPPLVLLALLTGAATAASPGALDSVSWQMRTFTTADGLAHDIVRDVLEDRQGRLWIATMSGVTRYDPEHCRYQTFVAQRPPARREAMALAQDPAGAIWVATQGGGVGRLHDGRWTWYTTAHGLPADELSSLMVDRRGGIWATPTSGGIARFAAGRWQAFSAADGLSTAEISRCAELGSGVILCGTYEEPLLQRYAGGRWTQLSVAPDSGSHFYVHALLESRQGVLWLATKGAGVIEGRPLPDGTYRWIIHDRRQGLASDRVGSIFLAQDGRLWCATSAGVSSYDGKRWQTLGREHGLGSNHIFAITQSRDGALWFATLGGGLSRYGPSRWRQLTEEQGLPSNTITGGLVVTAEGTLWAGTDRGLFWQRGERRGVLSAGDPERDHINHLLAARQPEGLWAATRRGVRQLRDGTWRDLPPWTGAGQAGAASPVASHLAEDSSGGLWVATPAGIQQFSGERWRTFDRTAGLPSERVYSVLAADDGAIWAGTANGLARYASERWQTFLSPGPESRTNRIYSLIQDPQRRIWASGLEGIYTRLAGDAWQKVPASSWLPAGIYSRFMMTTADGSMWFAIRGLGVRRRWRGRFTAYSTRDGLGADTISGVARTAGGELAFATMGGGLSFYRPDRRPPETFIGTHLGSPGTGAPSSVVEGEAATIPFGAQDVLKDTDTSQLRFSYRVDGGPWSDFSAATQVGLTGLAAGEHLLEVRAMDQDLNVDPSPARHALRVIRPWWAEPWLLVLVAGTLLLGLYATLRLTRAVARERAAIAAEQAALEQRRQFVRLASHELRRPLARLSHRAELLGSSLAPDDPRRDQHLAAIAEDARRLSRLVETLLAQSRLQDHLELQLQDGDLNELAAQVIAGLEPPSPEQLVFQPGAAPLFARYDAFYLELALRNLIENALKYGGGPQTPVQLVLRRQGGQVQLLISDQGPGVATEDRERIFEAFYRGATRGSHEGFGLGLGFARQIARAHGGDVTLLASDRGATFCLALPADGSGSDARPGSAPQEQT